MHKKLTIYVVAMFGLLVLLNSCKKEYETIESIDNAKIQAYVDKTKLDFKKEASGYRYLIVDPGAGLEIKNSDSIYYSYSFQSLDGRVFNQTTDLSIPSTLLGYSDQFYISGRPYLLTPIREVLSRLKKGGKAVVILPSHMAFGRNGIDLLGIGSNENILVNVGIYNLSSRHEANDFEINAFKTKNNLTLTKDISGAYYNVITPGTGVESISLSSKITAKYTVRYLNGTVLESSTDGGFSSTLNELYKGWQLILPKTVKAGGKVRLVLPSHIGSTDGNCLDFDIEIISVTN